MVFLGAFRLAPILRFLTVFHLILGLNAALILLVTGLTPEPEPETVSQMGGLIKDLSQAGLVFLLFEVLGLRGFSSLGDKSAIIVQAQQESEAHPGEDISEKTGKTLESMIENHKLRRRFSISGALASILLIYLAVRPDLSARSGLQLEDWLSLINLAVIPAFALLLWFPSPRQQRKIQRLLDPRK